MLKYKKGSGTIINVMSEDELKEIGLGGFIFGQSLGYALLRISGQIITVLSCDRNVFEVRDNLTKYLLKYYPDAVGVDLYLFIDVGDHIPSTIVVVDIRVLDKLLKNAILDTS